MQQTVIENLAKLFAWMVAHPVQVVTVLATLLATSYIIGAAVFAIWQAYVEQQQEAQRQRFEALINLSSKPPKAPGHPSRRVG